MLQPPHKALVDQCLGTNDFPTYLIGKGLDAFTVRQAFGRTDVADTEWIERAGQSEWLVFTKDAAIRRNIAEREAVRDNNLRVVCLANQSINFEEQVKVFEANWKRIEKWFDKPGPWIISVSASSVEKVYPDKKKR